MKTKSTKAAFFNLRILTGFALCSAGLLIGLAGLSKSVTGAIITTPESTKWYVNGVTGSDSNDCKSSTTACKTIGHAISLAASGDSISVAAATYTENLTINISLTITGAGATTTIIDGGAVDRVVAVSSATANVVLSKLTIRNGKFTGFPGGGGGIYNLGILTVSKSIVTANSAVAGFFAGNGGGIDNAGTLTITNSTLSGNKAVAGTSLRATAAGGGIYNGGTLTINRSTLSGNVGQTIYDMGAGANGGGMYLAGGSTTINDSTLSNNSVAGVRAESGGGIYNSGGTLTINNSTLSGNYCPDNGGGIENGVSGGTVTISNSTLSGSSTSAEGFGGGISNGGASVILQNSIVADNLYNGNCYGTITSNGYNLSSDDTCGFNNTGDLNHTNPDLGPLQDNGGPTQTQALLINSPAIDAGNPGGCTDGQGRLFKTDQRGKPRPDPGDTGGCDMGAYERQGE